MFVLVKNQMERKQVVADNTFETGFQMAQSAPTTALHKKPISPFQEIFGWARCFLKNMNCCVMIVKNMV